MWRWAAHDVHVATLREEFAGYVADSDSQYTAHDAVGRLVATAPSFDEARAAVESAAIPAVERPRPVTPRAHHTPRRRRRRGSRITAVVPDM